MSNLFLPDEKIFSFNYEFIEEEVEYFPYLIKRKIFASKNWSGLYEKKLLCDADISYNFYRKVVLEELVVQTEKRGAMSYLEIVEFVKDLKTNFP